MADVAIDQLLERVRQDLSTLEPLAGAVDTIADRVPDLEAKFPGAADAARSVLGMTKDIVAALPSSEEIARLAGGLASKIAPPVDADAFRQELAGAVSALAGIVETIADQPELPTIDLQPLEDGLAELTDRIPDSVVGQVGGLVAAIDLSGIAARAQQLRALADEIRDLVAKARSGPSDAKLRAARRKVSSIRAVLQIVVSALVWLRSAVPLSMGVDAFAVAKIDVTKAMGGMAATLVQIQAPLNLAILLASYLIAVIDTRLES